MGEVGHNIHENHVFKFCASYVCYVEIFLWISGNFDLLVVPDELSEDH